MNLSISRPFVLLASQCSGSTALAFALDSHPDIHCERAEPLGGKHPVTKFAHVPTPAERVGMALATRGYMVAGCKVQSDQLILNEDVREELVFRHPQVIRLTREVVDQAVSQLTQDGQTQLDPDQVVDQCHYFDRYRKEADAWLAGSGLPVTWVTYEQMVGDQGDIDWLPQPVADQLTGFLGVGQRSLSVSIRRNPTRKVDNWHKIRKLLRANGLA